MQVAHHRLVTVPRRRAHDQRPVDEFVAVPVIGQVLEIGRMSGRPNGNVLMDVMVPPVAAHGDTLIAAARTPHPPPRIWGGSPPPGRWTSREAGQVVALQPGEQVLRL